MENQNKNLVKFFNPQSIAIIGATDGMGKVGTAVTRNILNLGYGGKVFLVNPKRKELFGKECHSRLEDIEENIDLAVVIVPAGLVLEIVKNGANKTKNFVIISAGFGESGEEGKKREIELSKITKEKNLSILGPNCLGFIIPGIKLNATFAGGMPKRGNIGFISQSGALAAALMDIFKKEELGFSGIFSIGNKMQIDEADLIEHLGNDTDTKVIGMYLEGIKDGSKFMKIAGEISKLKPVVVLKAGKNEKSRKAISSHTGALAGSQVVSETVFEKCGIIQSKNLGDFIDALRLISMSNPPRDNSVAVITNAGGGGVLAADAFEGKILKTAELSKKTKDLLREKLPQESSVENPIDVLGDAREDRYGNVLDIIDEEEIGSVLCVLTPQEQTPASEIAEKIASFSHSTQKTIAANFMGGEKVREAISEMRKNNVPNFLFPDQAVAALDVYCQWGVWKSKRNAPEREIDQKRKKRAGEIIQKAKSEKRKALLFKEAEKIMEIYGIKVIDTWNCQSPGSLKFPAVVKVDSDKILHKTDKNGIILNVKSREELKRAIEKIKNYFPRENVIAQAMPEGQTEIILGIKRDEIFGPVITYGLGGIYTEIFKMVDFLVPPLAKKEIEDSVLKSKIKFLFKETRGKSPHNINELADIIEKTSFLALENPEIKELDINPLFIYNDGRKALAADIKVII